MISEVSVFLPNVAGELNRTLRVLANEDVNVLAFSIDQAGACSIIRLICSNPDKANELLKERGIVVEQSDVLALKMKHKAGELERVTEALTDAHVNIEYGYLTVIGGTSQAIVILKTGDETKALEVVQGAGFEDVTSLNGTGS
ncbi:MAG: amino acid-binding protein [Rhodospirillales bacterium]|jgi:hypothetical protein|nr:amino acid-binding protein [Rhodospirillales bacterium]